MITILNKEIIQAKKSKNQDKASILILLKSALVDNQKSKEVLEEKVVIKRFRKKLFKEINLYESLKQDVSSRQYQLRILDDLFEEVLKS